MDWSYGDWSRILIHDISSSTLCSEQTLSAFYYNMHSDLTTIFCSQDRANMLAIHFNMGNKLFLRRWLFCA